MYHCTRLAILMQRGDPKKIQGCEVLLTLVGTMFFPSTVLIALFAQPELPVKMAPLANELAMALPNLFPEDPTILPLPTDAPPILPSIVFQKMGVGRLTVARSRIDLLLQVESRDSWQNGSLNAIEQIAKALIQTGAAIGRVGLVLTYAFSDSVTVDYIREKYLRAGKASKAQAINVAWLNKTLWQDTPVNQWVKYVLSSEPAGERNLMIDVNTPSDMHINFAPHSVVEYVSYWLAQFDEKLGDIIEW